MSLCVLLLSCQKSGPERKPQPSGIRELVEVYSATRCYVRIDGNDLGTKIIFDNGESVLLLSREVVVEDCREAPPKVVAWDADGQWMVGGVLTGVYKEGKTADVDALPVYIYFDRAHLQLYLSNGNRFQYDYVDPDTVGEIPVIYLATRGSAPIVSKEEYVEGTIKILNPDRKFWDVEEYEAPMKIRGRGNSTWGMPKKSWKVKLAEKARLFDFSNDKEWCLLANYCDKSLLRNDVAMELSRRMGFRWTPKMVPVEVYLNGAYQGVYSFSEHKKVSRERININVDEGDILFEIDENQDEKVCWWTEHGAPMMFSEPEDPDAAAVAYAKKYFEDFETALWAKDFTKAYQYIDLKSFIDNYIIQELTKNVDGNLRRSTFLTLEKGGQLVMYHVWDFDICLGNCDYYGDGRKTWEGWWVKDRSAWGQYHGWYYRMFMDKDFVAKVKARWNELYPELATIPDYIDKRKGSMRDAPARNFKKWDILNQYVWPNAKVTGSYDKEVDWLKENYTKRLEWLNANINAL